MRGRLFRWGRTVRIALCGGALSYAHVACGAVVYTEDFSDISEWIVVYNDQGGGVNITTDGDLGSFFVEGGNNFVAFAQDPILYDLAPFVYSPNYQYQLHYQVAGLSGSTSYSIEIDQFDGSQNYISTVFGVVPQGTFVGSNTVSFSGLPFNPAAEYILPKITIYTGLGEQTVTFDSLDIELNVVPEPASFMLVVLGALVVRTWRKTARPVAGVRARKVQEL